VKKISLPKSVCRSCPVFVRRDLGRKSDLFRLTSQLASIWYWLVKRTQPKHPDNEHATRLDKRSRLDSLPPLLRFISPVPQVHRRTLGTLAMLGNYQPILRKWKRQTVVWNRVRKTMEPISEKQARTMTVCVCGKPKDVGCEVCWDCFKRGDLPLKYFDGPFEEWQKKHKTA